MFSSKNEIELSRSKMKSHRCHSHARSLYLVEQMNLDVVRSSKYAAIASKEPGGLAWHINLTRFIQVLDSRNIFSSKAVKGHFQPQIG